MLNEMKRQERSKELARYIVTHRATLREVANKFGMSRATVHKYVTVVLKSVDHKLYYQVREVLDYNFAQKAFRGGEATRRKYKDKR